MVTVQGGILHACPRVYGSESRKHSPTVPLKGGLKPASGSPTPTCFFPQRFCFLDPLNGYQLRSARTHRLLVRRLPRYAGTRAHWRSPGNLHWSAVQCNTCAFPEQKTPQKVMGANKAPGRTSAPHVGRPSNNRSASLAPQHRCWVEVRAGGRTNFVSRANNLS